MYSLSKNNRFKSEFVQEVHKQWKYEDMFVYKDFDQIK